MPATASAIVKDRSKWYADVHDSFVELLRNGFDELMCEAVGFPHAQSSLVMWLPSIS